MFDIEALATKPESAARMQVLDLNNQAVEGVGIFVRAFAHPEVAAVIRKQKVKASMNRDRRNQVRDLSPEEEEANGIELLMVLIEGWEGFARAGKEWPCSEANKRELCSEKKWLSLQNDVVRFASNDANFLAVGAAGSGAGVGEAVRVAAHKAGKGESDEG